MSEMLGEDKSYDASDLKKAKLTNKKDPKKGGFGKIWASQLHLSP